MDMAFLSIIRRWHKREHVPIREISRRTGVSRNTIRKYLGDVPWNVEIGGAALPALSL